MRVCARVLAAALMMGAVGVALAFPALFPPGNEEHRSLVAPPSSQQRTLRLPAVHHPARHVTVSRERSTVARRTRVKRQLPPTGELVTAPVRRPKTTAPVSPAPTSSSPVSQPTPPAPASPPGTTPEPVTPAAPTTAAAPPPIAAPRELAAASPPPATPQVQAAVPSAPANEDGGDTTHGNGHAYGHDKHENGGGSDGPKDTGGGHGEGHAYGHDN